MAKRICFESDFVDGVIFDSKEEMITFDSLINSKDYYLECCKKYIKNYYEYLCDEIANMLDLEFNNGKIIIDVDMCNDTLSEYITSTLDYYDLCDTYFSELAEDISEDGFNDMCECACEYVINKIKEFADDINKLVEFELNLS